MMVEDLGVEAKEAAVREVAKLLPLPELLQSISSIKADYIARQQANDAHLSTMVAEQVEQAQAGLESLSLSQMTISGLRENFVEIEKYEDDAIVNDCWGNSHEQCVFKKLGRFSFQPLSENPLLGPSASG
ncbi:SNARE-binding exocyst subunit S6 [Castilleja foliolosa]|uniref:SNARE-binding exocyst subunit S6 n=1 Tax=Castilleja foliolosa TaxID=1961234 RepID=A0ABD3DDK8_9LAMI